NNFASIQGQPYAEINVASDRTRILEYYSSHGFPSTSFSYRKEPGPDPATMNVTYRIREGPQEFVRRIVISGLRRTRPSLVEHQIHLRPGEPESLTRMNDDARALTGLGVFATVNTALQNPDGSTRYKDVLYDVDEAARYNYSLGVGLIVGQFGGTTTNLTNAG